jgi:maltose alpha-D-glucosyltransferase/alpha-amylase
MRRRKEEGADALAPNPQWYKEAVIYEIHIRAFADSNDDGIGDFNGLVERLDYLQDLGVTALWLLPFYPSPLRDGGYDISDYTKINPAYGNLKDFSRLLKEAHRRGIRIITELVLNHTSSEHEWFQRARRAEPGSKGRNYYVWSDTPNRYADARIIFKDFETSNWCWDPVAKSYYWHRFYSHQPDLNFENPEVHKALLKVIDFWLDLGVDGMRLDAVPYLFEEEGTNCENLPRTHEFLKTVRTHIDSRYRDRMLLAEANQWPEDAAAYFGSGDECHMNFHFPLMPRMFMSVHLEDRFPIVDILRQTPNIPLNCQWATFLRTHDELTLEMVTDEDRDYMYRVYAEDPNARINLGIRRRLAPLVKGRRKIELMNAMLFSLPGTPVLYYGDEIGMGDNIYLGDRDGVRTPMQWSADRNAGFSRANPQKLYLPVITDPEYHYESNNVQAQQANASSLLWWMKRLIALRKENEVLGTGGIEFLLPDNPKVLAFIRSDGRRSVLVVINLSRFSQCAELDLTQHQQLTPVEMFGRTPFPTITDKPYFLSLGPHSFYWFALEEADAASGRRETPRIEVVGGWLKVFNGRERTQLSTALVEYAVGRRWFRGKARPRKGARIADVLQLDGEKGCARLVLLQVDYVEGDPEIYVVPIAFRSGEEAIRVMRDRPQAKIASLVTRDGGVEVEGVLVDGLADDAPVRLMDMIRKKRDIGGERGEMTATMLRAFKEVAGDDHLLPRTSEFEQTNSSILIGDKMLLKVYRMLEMGPNPELELGAYLTEHAPAVKDASGNRIARRAPRMLGALEYHAPHWKEPATVATVQELIANEGVAWDTANSALDRYFDRVLQLRSPTTALPAIPPPGAPSTLEEPQLPPGNMLEQGKVELPESMLELLGGFVRRARQLGRRTAELHLVLGAEPADPSFASQPFTGFYQQSLFQGAHKLWVRTAELLRKNLGKLPEPLQSDVKAIANDEVRIDKRLRTIASRKLEVARVRIHGDLHLGQVLDTGDDFVFIDFEGEPGRPLNERRYKRCPLFDVAGMLRSFHYASEAVLRSGRLRAEDATFLRPWARAWTAWVRAAFLHEYLMTVGNAPFVPVSDEDKRLMLEFYQLEKCIYEIRYELNNRPDWLEIPLAGLQEIMSREAQ